MIPDFLMLQNQSSSESLAVAECLTSMTSFQGGIPDAAVTQGDVRQDFGGVAATQRRVARRQDLLRGGRGREGRGVGQHGLRVPQQIPRPVRGH